MHYVTGAILIDMGKPVDALASAQKSRVIGQQLVDTYPAVTTFQDVLASSHSTIGEALTDMAKPAQAMAALDKALDIWQKLAQGNPSDHRVQYVLSLCYNDIGELLAQLGKPAEALQLYQKAQVLQRKQAEAYPAYHPNFVLEIVASSHDKTSLLLSTLGRTAEALTACREAIAIRQKLSDAQPALAWLKWELAGSFLTLGTVQRRAGRPADAVTSFRRAIELVENLPRLTPRNHYGLACSHAQLAAIAAEAGSGMTAEQGVAEAERAIVALQQAYSGGFGIAHLRADAALDALRSREDFQKLLKESEAKTAAASRSQGEPQPRPGNK